MFAQVKSLGKELTNSAQEEQSDNSGDEPSDEPGSALSPPEFRIDLFEQPRLRMHAFIERLGEAANQPANLDKYRSELSAKKAQLVYNTSMVLSIVDSMIKKARSTRKLKRNWSKYDLIVMFWIIEKYSPLVGHRPHEYVKKRQRRHTKSGRKHRYACLFKWLNLKMNGKAAREPWGEEEGEMLLKMVAERKANGLDHLKCHWSVVSRRLYLQCGPPRIFRTAKQCRQRWGCTNPEVKKDLWSRKQDIQLLKRYLEIGKKWAIISRELVARTENAVKNRFELLEKKIVNRAKKESQQPVRSFISRYIDELQIEEYLNGHTQPKVEDVLEETYHIGSLPTISTISIATAQTKEQKAREQPVETVHRKESPPKFTLNNTWCQMPRENYSQGTKKVRVCKMTAQLLRSTVKKGLVPAVLDQQQIFLKPHSAAKPIASMRPIGWAPCYQPSYFQPPPNMP